MNLGEGHTPSDLSTKDKASGMGMLALKQPRRPHEDADPSHHRCSSPHPMLPRAFWKFSVSQRGYQLYGQMPPKFQLHCFLLVYYIPEVSVSHTLA